jgi:hypothetical protein
MTIIARLALGPIDTIWCMVHQIYEKFIDLTTIIMNTL